MTFFAKKRDSAEVAEAPAFDRPNPIAEKVLATFGVSYADVVEKGNQLGQLLADYTARLDRVEKKLDQLLERDPQLAIPVRRMVEGDNAR